MGFECNSCEFRTFDFDKVLEHSDTTEHHDFEYDYFNSKYRFDVKVSRQT